MASGGWEDVQRRTYLDIIILLLWDFFHTSVNWLSSTGVCVTASLRDYYHFYYHLFLESFSTSVLANGCSLELEWYSKSPQVSRTLLSILVIFNDVIVWMVFTRPPFSKCSSPFYNPLVTVPKAPIAIVSFMFHCFFQLPSKIELFILFFTFFPVLFCDQPAQQSPQFYKFSFFCWLL